MRHNNKNRNISLNKIGLKRRIWIAVSLVTFLPVIIFLYYLTNYYVAPITILIIGFIVFLGWWIVFEIFSTIITISTRSQETINKIKDLVPPGEDGYIKNEVERLDFIFNTLSVKVKDSVEELKRVGSKTEELNKAINQKVNILSSILQANAFLSKGAPFEDIIQFLTEGLKEAIVAQIVIVFIRKHDSGGHLSFFCGITEEKVSRILDEKYIPKFFGLEGRYLFDLRHRGGDFIFLEDEFGFKNFMINPMQIRGKTVGCVIVENSLSEFLFPPDSYEIIDLFTHNIGIIWERQRLSQKVDDLETDDPVTGIYNEKAFFGRFGEEIKRATAYQRPCGFVVTEISNFDEYKKRLSDKEIEKVLKRLVKVCRDNIRPIDILGRISPNRFGVVLVERNRRQSNYVGAKLKEALYTSLKETTAIVPHISFAVAENPIDGANVPQLFERIQSQLKST